MISSEEMALLRLAMRRRLLPAHAVQEVVERKKWDAPDRPIAGILLDMGVLEPAAVEELARAVGLESDAAAARGGGKGPGAPGSGPDKQAAAPERRHRATQIARDPAAREPRDGALRGLPEKIGPYRLVRLLGAGAMGAVYHARHEDLERDVALKLLQSEGAPTARAVQRFRREARLAARLDHPNVVRVYEAGQDGGYHYIAMDMVRGRSVAELIALGEISVRRAVHVMRKTAEAVGYAHDQGVIHRDLKPANILVDERTGEPRVTDFGLAVLAEPDEDDKLTRTGAAVGTPAYMAPEQVRGQLDRIDARTDVYALGATLYEMLTGSPPFDAATFLELAKRICDQEPVSPRRRNPTVPLDVETVCLKALEKSPDERYPTAHAFAHDLAAFLDDGPIVAQRPSTAERTRRWVRRNRGLAAGAAGLLCVALAGLVLWLRLPGTIELATDPAGAVVLVDGRELRDARGELLTTPRDGVLRFQVPAGRHQLGFRLQGYLERALGVDDVEVGHGGTLRLTASLVSAKGLLRVETRPSVDAPVQVLDAEGIVRRDKRTPLVDAIEAGTYRVVVGATGGYRKPAEVRVVVLPGGVEAEVTVPLELDRGQLEVEAEPDNVVVRTARDPHAELAPVRLPGSGRHQVTLTKLGHLPRRLEVDVPEGARVARRATLVPLAAGRWPLEGRLVGAPLVRDVDGDGAPDLVTLEAAGDGRWLTVYPGLGGAPARARVRPDASRLVECEDLDGDGVLDPIVGAPGRVEVRHGRTGRPIAHAPVDGGAVALHRPARGPARLVLLERGERLRAVPLGPEPPGDLQPAPGARAPLLHLTGARAFAPTWTAVAAAQGALLLAPADGGPTRRVELPGATPDSALASVAVQRDGDQWVAVVPPRGPALVVDLTRPDRVLRVGDDGARFSRPLVVLGDRAWLLLEDEAKGATRAFALLPDGAREGPRTLGRGALLLRAAQADDATAEVWCATGELFRLEGDRWTLDEARSADPEPWAARDDEAVVADLTGDGRPGVLRAAPDRRAVVLLDPSPDRLRWRARLPQAPAEHALADLGSGGGPRGDLALALGERLLGLAGDDGRHLLDLTLEGAVRALAAGPDRPDGEAGALLAVLDPPAQGAGGEQPAGARVVRLARREGAWRPTWTVARPARGVDATTVDLDGDRAPEVLVGGPLACLRGADGTEVWTQRLGGAPDALGSSGPRFAAGEPALCVGPRDPSRPGLAATLVAHDVRGSPIWEAPLLVDAEPAAGDAPRRVLTDPRLPLVVVLTGRRLLGLQRTDGNRRWTLGALDVVDAALSGQALALTRADGALEVIDAVTGAVRWRRALAGAGPGRAPSGPLFLPAPQAPEGAPPPVDAVAVVTPQGALARFAVDDGAFLGETRPLDGLYRPRLDRLEGGLVALWTDDGYVEARALPAPVRPAPSRRVRVLEQVRRLEQGASFVLPAVEALRALAREDPDDALAQQALCRALAASEDWARALEAARAALAIRPDLPLALRVRLEASFALDRDVDAAIARLEELARVDLVAAGEAAVTLATGLTGAPPAAGAAATQAADDAARLLRRARDLAPGDPAVRRRLGLALLAGIPGLALWSRATPDELADLRKRAAEARVELVVSLTRQDDVEARAAALVALVVERRVTAVFMARRPSRADHERLGLLAGLGEGLVAQARASADDDRLLGLAKRLVALPDDQDARDLADALAALRPAWKEPLAAIKGLRP